MSTDVLDILRQAYEPEPRLHHTLSNEGYLAAEKSYQDRRAKLHAEMSHCGYCKRAQRNGRFGCKRHSERSRLIYVTSPISETYWAS